MFSTADSKIFNGNQAIKLTEWSENPSKSHVRKYFLEAFLEKALCVI
jgi:hypothetical protein